MQALTAVDSWVESIFFGANCVVIVKMTEQERERFLHRTYTFQARLKKLIIIKIKGSTNLEKFL